ncbi:MAG: hypothetical protein SFZ23_07695 [Planctomycetota bacterium]|nr:hypothetical protein [Planctomycetota bacterium]
MEASARIAFVSSALVTSIALGTSTARFYPIPNADGVPLPTPNGCAITGFNGLYGVRVSGDGRTVAAVGYIPSSTSGSWRPVRWTVATGSIAIAPDIEVETGELLYGIMGLSNDGSVVWGANWRWSQASGFENLTNLTRPPGDPFQTKIFFGCDDAGTTAVGTVGVFPLATDIFTWNIDAEPAPTRRPLDNADFPLGGSFFAAISGDGTTLAGGARTEDDIFAPTRPRGFTPAVWLPNQAFGQNLFPALDQGVTWDISRTGAVGVGSLTGFPQRPFTWTPAQGVTFLPIDPPGASDSAAAYAVSQDAGIIVGGRVNFGQPGSRAVYWDDSGYNDLTNVLVTRFGLGNVLAGWRLELAVDVSHDGRTIVGEGINPQGCRQSWAVVFSDSCPADFNSDGQVDFFDYLDFAQAFGTDDASADFNANGQVDFFDYLDYVAAFDRGC